MPEEQTNSSTTADASVAPSDDFNQYIEQRESEAAAKAEGTPKATKAEAPPAKTAGETEPPKPPQEPEEEDDEPDETDATKPKRKGGFRRTIDKLNRQNQELADKLLALEARLGPPKRDESEQKPLGAKDEAEDKEPQPEDYPDDYDKYVRAASRWEARQELKQERERLAKETAERHIQEADRKVKAAWQERQTAARKQYADYDDVVSTAESPVSLTMQNMLLESEDGPALLYYLARNPAEADRIFQLAPITQVREMERIASRIKPSNSTPETKTRPVSSAPKPVRPLQGGSNPEGAPSSALSEWYDEYEGRFDKKKRSA